MRTDTVIDPTRVSPSAMNRDARDLLNALLRNNGLTQPAPPDFTASGNFQMPTGASPAALRRFFLGESVAKAIRRTDMLARGGKDTTFGDLNVAQRLTLPWVLAKARADMAGHSCKAAHAYRGTPERQRKSWGKRKDAKTDARERAVENHVEVMLNGVDPKHLSGHARRRMGGRGR